MKLPEELLRSPWKDSTAGQRLVDLLTTAPQDKLLEEIVQCFLQVISGKSNDKATKDDKCESPFLSAASVVENLMFIHPRGKQSLGFFEDRLVIKTSKQEIVVPSDEVTDVVILDSIPKDTKNRVLILLNFGDDANIMNGKSRMRACVIQVHATQEIEMNHPKDPSRSLSGNAAVVLCQAIGSCGISPQIFHSSSPDVFKSCTSTSAVEAFVKARQGYLFPLSKGICFLESPAIFIHHDSIRSVDFARAGGASSTFDFQVHLKNGSVEEFSSISRHELGCIQDWVGRLNLPVGFPSDSEDEDGEDEPEVTSNEGSSDDDDDDFDPYKPREKRLKSDGNVGSGGDDDSHKETDQEESSSDDSDDDIELVSEEDFNIDQLQEILEKEKAQTRKTMGDKESDAR